MARDYGIVSSRFWTGPTGKAIKAKGQNTQLVALYLLTCPSSNMIGLYYLPLVLIVDETGMERRTVQKAIANLGEIGFALYDHEQQVVYVPEMAKYQIGASLAQNDKRVCSVNAQWKQHCHSFLAQQWMDRYRTCYHLDGQTPENKPDGPNGKPSPKQAPSKGHRSPSEAPPKPEIRDQRSENKKIARPAPRPPSEEEIPFAVLPLKAKPRDELFDTVAEVCGVDPATAGSYIAKVCKSLRKADPPYSPAEVRCFWDKHCQFIRSKGERPTLGMLERDVGKVRAKAAQTVPRKPAPNEWTEEMQAQWLAEKEQNGRAAS